MQTPGNALFFHAIIFLSYALSFWHAHACTGRTFDQASFAWNPVHEEPFRAKEWISQILRAHRRYGRIHRSHKENQVLFQKVWQETSVPEGHAQGDRRIVIEGLFHSTLLQKHSVLSFAGSCTRQHHRTLVSSDRSPGSREDVFQQLP